MRSLGVLQPLAVSSQNLADVGHVKKLIVVGYVTKFPASVHLKGFVYLLKRKSRKTAKNSVPNFLLLDRVYFSFESHKSSNASEYHSECWGYYLTVKVSKSWIFVTSLSYCQRCELPNLAYYF